MERLSVVALGGVAVGSAAMPKPVVWHVLGYQFEAAAMLAAMFAAITTRVIINTRNKSSSRVLDTAVLLLVLVTTWAIVASLGANLITGLLYGTGIATIGEGLIAIAEKYTRKGLSFLDIENMALPPATPPTPDDHAAIDEAVRKLDAQD